jgi:SAM-dependent methyltransferase
MTVVYSNKEKPTKPRQKLDFYPTNKEFCRVVLQRIKDEGVCTNPKIVLDPGCGNGNWGKEFRSVYGDKPNLLGVDIDVCKYEDMDNHLSQYTDVRELDFIKWNLNPKFVGFDLIMGNPPYYIAEKFVEKSHSLLSDNGVLVFLLTLSFVESKRRYKKYYSGIKLKPDRVWVSTRRLDFFRELGLEGSGDYKAMGVFIWSKNHKNFKDELGFPTHQMINKTAYTELDWIDWDFDD